MDKVADPLPVFASTTSVPTSCVLFVRALMSFFENELLTGVAYMEQEDIRYQLTLQVYIIAPNTTIIIMNYYYMHKKVLLYAQSINDECHTRLTYSK
jgi:hypothetical protein